ncbi:MAG: long-chain fatty acid--CoA ligase [Chloroflexi bacterium]|nr:long-chain fatty acid--CoA ligase [Chloroflexota bacterium]
MSQEKPWLKFYEAHVPEHIDYPKTTIAASILKTAQENPDHTAVIFKGNKISYRKLEAAIKRFASALQGLGIKKGDRVAIHLPNCPQFPIAYYGVLISGAIVVPCNPVYTPRELKHQLNDSGAKLIVTLSSFYPMVKELRQETKLEDVLVAKIKTYFPPVLNLLFTLLKEKKDGHKIDIAGDADTYWFSDILENAAAEPEHVQITEEDTAVLMYTGGTTGLSKGAELSHRNIFVNAYQVTVWVNGLDGNSSYLVALPLFHSYAMTVCMNPGAIVPNTMVLVPNPRDIDDVLKTIDKHKPDFYPGVPAMYIAINNHPNVGKYDLRSLKGCNSGAAPLPVEVQERFQELTGARLVEGYGLSEASPVTHTNPAFGESRIGTIGLPYPDTEVKIVDIEDGNRILGTGEVGELCIRGPQIMKGYWNLPEETANTLRPAADGGKPWLYTGDIASMDEDGYFQIIDRKKDMILGAGGLNVYPREIEDVLFEHSKVLEAAAIGIEIEGKGERVKAFVVLKQGESATEEELIAFCREYLAPYKVPKFIEFRDDLPKTLVGKVLRRKLQAQEF